MPLYHIYSPKFNGSLFSVFIQTGKLLLGVENMTIEYCFDGLKMYRLR